LRTFWSSAGPSLSESTYFAGVFSPLTVRDAVAKPTGAPVLSSESFILTVNEFCAYAERLNNITAQKSTALQKKLLDLCSINSGLK
jgi:hypothetical protein